MSVLSDLLILLSGLICGVIVFQTSIIAPSVFKTLDADNASPFLRTIFPKLFVMIAFLSAIGLTIAFMQDNLKLTLIFMISAWLMLLCYFIVPATNRARDSGNQKRFSLLHTLSVVSTIAVLLINLLWIFF